MSQNPNNNPYGSNPNYPPTPGTAYGGQPSTGPNPNYGQPPSGPNPNYGQYAPPPPTNPNDPTPNSNYGSPYAPPPPGSDALAGPYDPTVFSQQSGATYPSYSSPSNPGYGAPPISNPGYGALPSNPGYGASPSNPGYGAIESNPGYGASPSNPGYGAPVSNPGFTAPPNIPPMMPPPRKSNARTLIIAVIALLVIVGGILGAVLYNNHNTAINNANSTATAQALAQSQATGTAQALVSATANAQATATYVKNHYPFSTNLVLNDSLSDNSNATKYGWDVGKVCAFTNGTYEATETQTNFIQPCTAMNTNFANFTYEIQMTIKSGGTGATGGVFFRANMGKDQLYLLELDTKGGYILSVRANSSGASSRTLKSGTISGFATGFNQVHTIGIVANGSQISVYVDQNKVTETSDPTYTGGEIGVISEYGSTTTVVDYNNAKVWQI